MRYFLKIFRRFASLKSAEFETGTNVLCASSEPITKYCWFDHRIDVGSGGR